MLLQTIHCAVPNPHSSCRSVANCCIARRVLTSTTFTFHCLYFLVVPSAICPLRSRPRPRSHIDASCRYGKHSYRGQQSAAVPQPVCLVVYTVVMLIAVYRGNPRRGLKRLRRMQRRARSSLYAKRRRLAARRNTPGGARSEMPLIRGGFSIFGFSSDGTAQRLLRVDLFSENRLQLNQAVDNNSVPSLDINEETTQETVLMGTCDVALKNNRESTAASPAVPPASKNIAPDTVETIVSPTALPTSKDVTPDTVETMGLCPKQTMKDNKLEDVNKATTATPNTFSSVRTSATQTQAVQRSGATSSAQSPIAAVFDATCCSAKSLIGKPASIPVAALASKGTSTSTVETIGT